MKSSLAVMVAMMAASRPDVGAKQPAKPAGNRVIVYVTSREGNISGFEMVYARFQASRLFEAAGIRLEWRSGAPKADPGGARVVGIRFLPAAPDLFCDRDHEKALAVAQPYATGLTSIEIFSDRVHLLLSTFDELDAGKVLGHVLAHELGHVLEGIARHSDAGLMKARWEPRDYSVMIRSGLNFAEEDVALLQANIAAPAAE